MKKSVIVRKCVPFFLCCLLVLSVLGCSSGTPSSAEGIPLLLRYTDSTQHEDKLLKMTWDPEKALPTSTRTLLYHLRIRQRSWIFGYRCLVYSMAFRLKVYFRLILPYIERCR